MMITGGLFPRGIRPCYLELCRADNTMETNSMMTKLTSHWKGMIWTIGPLFLTCILSTSCSDTNSTASAKEHGQFITWRGEPGSKTLVAVNYLGIRKTQEKWFDLDGNPVYCGSYVQGKPFQGRFVVRDNTGSFFVATFEAGKSVAHAPLGDKQLANQIDRVIQDEARRVRLASKEGGPTSDIPAFVPTTVNLSTATSNRKGE